MDKAKFYTFLYIMAVYIFISYILLPIAFYFFLDKSLLSAGNGFVAGSILSIILWFVVGSKMVK
jgi:pilus assembly protein TadC